MSKLIGLFQMDNKPFPNLALMKLSAYHKFLGDTVRWYSPLYHKIYDIIYASKIFDYPSHQDPYLKDNMIIGGPGYDMHKTLTQISKEIDHIYPDYSLYKLSYALGYITKGCSRMCEWCIIPKMEGGIHKFATLEEFTKTQRHVRLLDNNILAYKYHLRELDLLISSGKRFDFTQGFDIRLITKKNATYIRELKTWHGLRYKFAFDDPSLKKTIEKKVEILFNAGFTSGILQFYILIGYNTTLKEDLIRVHFLQEKGIDLFAMPYDKMDPWQMKFARWINRHYYKYCSWQDFKSNKPITVKG